MARVAEPAARQTIMRTLRPTRGWSTIDLSEIIDFKDLLVELARRDIKLRYRQTLLGVAWVVLQPLLAAALLTFAFGVVAGLKTTGMPAFLVTYAGLLAWNVFGWTLSKTSVSMVGNAYLVSKVYFPRLILPLSGAISTLLDVAISLAVFGALLAGYGIGIGWPMLLLPIWIALLLCLALGAGLIAAALTVEYRDVQHILPVVIPFALYASPVAYEMSQIPDAYRSLMYLLNPLAPLIAGFRWSMLGRAPAPAAYVMWSAAVSVGMFAAGAAIFRRTERKLADVI
jgi:lipopolysaccharide transport system permease protein